MTKTYVLEVHNSYGDLMGMLTHDFVHGVGGVAFTGPWGMLGAARFATKRDAEKVRSDLLRFGYYGTLKEPK